MKLIPGLTDDLVKEMRKPPVRSDDPSICKIMLNASGWSTRPSDRFSRRQ